MRVKYLVVSVLCALVAYSAIKFNKYMTHNDYPLQVVELYSGMSNSKYPTTEFIAVMKTEDGIIFDRRVSAAFFSQTQKGDKIVLSLRPFDIKQTFRDNLIFFFGAVVIQAASGVVSLFALIGFFSRSFRNWIFSSNS